MYVVLTVCDHEKNGFISLAKWFFENDELAKKFINHIEELIKIEENKNEENCSFIIEINGTTNDIRFTSINLNLKHALLIAPEQVRSWLAEKPDPEKTFFRAVPTLEIPIL